MKFALFGFVTLSAVLTSGSQAALTVTNGLMTNGNVVTALSGWSNNVPGGIEGKNDNLAGGASDDFGSLVFSGSTTTGSTNNDWAGILAGSTISLTFDLFNERLIDLNGATDITAELLIDGVSVTNVVLLRASETYDNTQTRTPYSAPDYTVLAGDIGKQVDVRFTATAADQAWHQTGIDNVALTVTPIPEPSVIAIFGLAGVVVAFRRRR